MYKEILNYLGCLIYLPGSITFTHSSRSGMKASLWTPFTDNAKCTANKLNLKACTICSFTEKPQMVLKEKKKVLSSLVD